MAEPKKKRKSRQIAGRGMPPVTRPTGNKRGPRPGAARNQGVGAADVADRTPQGRAAPTAAGPSAGLQRGFERAPRGFERAPRAAERVARPFLPRPDFRPMEPSPPRAEEPEGWAPDPQPFIPQPYVPPVPQPFYPQGQGQMELLPMPARPPQIAPPRMARDTAPMEREASQPFLSPTERAQERAIAEDFQRDMQQREMQQRAIQEEMRRAFERDMQQREFEHRSQEEYRQRVHRQARMQEQPQMAPPQVAPQQIYNPQFQQAPQQWAPAIPMVPPTTIISRPQLPQAEPYELNDMGYVGSYEGGGTVPGVEGKPYLAIVHGGEKIIPADVEWAGSFDDGTNYVPYGGKKKKITTATPKEKEPFKTIEQVVQYPFRPDQKKGDFGGIKIGFEDSRH